MSVCIKDCFQDIGNGYVKTSVGLKRSIIKVSSIERVELRDIIVTLYNSASDIIVMYEATSVQNACDLLDHIDCVLTGRKVPMVFSPELRKLLKTNIFALLEYLKVPENRFSIGRLNTCMQYAKIKTVQDFIEYGFHQCIKHHSVTKKSLAVLKEDLVLRDSIFESFGKLTDPDFCELLGLSFKQEPNGLRNNNR